MMQKELVKIAVEKWGKDHQLMVAVEEMGEAISAISQMVNRGRDVEDNVIEELGDVCLMMEQMKFIYGERLHKAELHAMKKLRKHLEVDGVV